MSCIFFVAVFFPFKGCLRGHGRYRGNVRVSQEGDTNLPTQEFCEDRFQGKDNISILIVERSTAAIANGTSYQTDKRQYRNSSNWFDLFYISTGGGALNLCMTVVV